MTQSTSNEPPDWTWGVMQVGMTGHQWGVQRLCQPPCALLLPASLTTAWPAWSESPPSLWTTRRSSQPGTSQSALVEKTTHRKVESDFFALLVYPRIEAGPFVRGDCRCECRGVDECAWN